MSVYLCVSVSCSADPSISVILTAITYLLNCLTGLGIHQVHSHVHSRVYGPLLASRRQPSPQYIWQAGGDEPRDNQTSLGAAAHVSPGGEKSRIDTRADGRCRQWVPGPGVTKHAGHYPGQRCGVIVFLRGGWGGVLCLRLARDL